MAFELSTTLRGTIEFWQCEDVTRLSVISYEVFASGIRGFVDERRTAIDSNYAAAPVDGLAASREVDDSNRCQDERQQGGQGNPR